MAMKFSFEDVYRHIGYLFYALAAEHGKLNTVTFDKLTRLVDQQWYPSGGETTVETQLVGHLHDGLRTAFEMAKPSSEAFFDFKSYYSIHVAPFGQSLRSRIFSTSNTIASEFSGNGKKSAFLTELEKLLVVNPIALV